MSLDVLLLRLRAMCEMYLNYSLLNLRQVVMHYSKLKQRSDFDCLCECECMFLLGGMLGQWQQLESDNTYKIM